MYSKIWYELRKFCTLRVESPYYLEYVFVKVKIFCAFIMKLKGFSLRVL